MKVKRAKHHIDHLERIFAAYIRNNMQRARRQRQGNPSRKAAAIGIGFPEEVPAIIGDAVHNLRASLDHAYCVLVNFHSGWLDDLTRFPFGKDRPSLEGSINGQKKRPKPLPFPAPGIIDFILDKIEPYEGGKLELYELHRLDITDKHKVLIPTAQVMHIDRLDFEDAKGRLTGAGIQGITFMRANQHSPDPEFVVSEGSSFKLHGDPNTAFEILFEDGQPFAGESVLQKLSALANNVSAALDGLERVGSS